MEIYFETAAPDPSQEIQPGSQFFLHGSGMFSLSVDQLIRIFEKYGEVEDCRIVHGPVTKRSRGYGSVTMATVKQADAAKGLRSEIIDGRLLSIERINHSVESSDPVPASMSSHLDSATPRAKLFSAFEDE
jgi:RNA recognition motif-containing protein